MKECSKCKQQLDESKFVKSDRYLDGLYPSCSQCRKQAQIKTLAEHPMCCACKVKPHLPYVMYCMECHRIKKGRSVVPSRIVDRTNKEWCSRCRERPRLPYHRYCQICKNASTSKWLAKFKTVRPPDEYRRKKSARHYINTLYRRGKVKRLLCEHCGDPSQNFHHLDYKDRTVNVQHLCFTCHVKAERLKRQLTE